MNGALTVEICDTGLNCCNAGNIDSDRDDFNKGHVDVFYGGMIRECEGTEMADGAAILIVTHNGIDGWKGEWIRSFEMFISRVKLVVTGNHNTQFQ